MQDDFSFTNDINKASTGVFLSGVKAEFLEVQAVEVEVSRTVRLADD
jgi:hypothetical protein